MKLKHATNEHNEEVDHRGGLNAPEVVHTHSTDSTDGIEINPRNL